jgi:hypothetical protein
MFTPHPSFAENLGIQRTSLTLVKGIIWSPSPSGRLVGKKDVWLTSLILSMVYIRDSRHYLVCVISHKDSPPRPKLAVRKAVMMLAYRLVRLIETHSASLSAGLLAKVQSSELTRSYRNVPAEDLKDRVGEIYSHLGEWLLGKSSFDIERRYEEIGARRVHQGVPVSELIWVIILTKENLWEFLKKESLPERPSDAFGELEMLQLLDQFFDRAIYYASVGFERAMNAQEPARLPVP